MDSPAAKTLPPGYVLPEVPDSDEEDSACGKRPCVEMLQDEVERLQGDVARLEGVKRRKKTFKPGSTQVFYLMNTMQRFYDTQKRQQSQHKEESPGDAVRLMLMNLLDEWMIELDETAGEKGFDWRKVPKRPHAHPVVFNVN